MHEFDSWVVKGREDEKTRRREDEKTRRREDEKGEKRVFRKIREKLEQRFGLGEILGMREGEMGETRFLGKKGKARADIRFRRNIGDTRGRDSEKTGWLEGEKWFLGK
ncbi:hypothetical protein NGM67_15925 [Photobacterium damselae]|uniref:hypothetical protein n=1 Tax=Photobacterium damselae TaxID=38293 RepID=UPI0020914FD0|nr:hypothetical protein [Photobacterium damselae]USR76636.1 hypothetical protein NGM67_15925 [Photobacterium damselae]